MSYLSFILSFSIIIFAILTVIAQNPIISVVYLISVFVATACNLILNGINFIGIAYIIVYVGAILVIFLFVILLFDLKQLITLQSDVKFNNLLLSLAIVSLFTFIITSVWYSDIYTYYNQIIINNDLFNFLDYSLLADLSINKIQQVQSIGFELYTSYALLLIIISIILLLAMLAVIFLK